MEVVNLGVKPLEMTSDSSDIELPLILKDRVLLSPGNWNGYNFTSQEIEKAFLRTDWANKSNYSLIYEHDAKAQNFLGYVKNPRTRNGTLVGDLEIYDGDLALKLGKAKAKLGISARVLGEPDELDTFKDFTFNNFSVVYEPACADAYINLSKEKAMKKIAELKKQILELEDNITTANTVKGSPTGTNTNEEREEELKKVSNFEEVRKQKKMSVTQFYAAPRDPPSSSKLPIYDAAHTRNALARFNQTDFLSEEEKNKAKRKIRTAAKKFGIKVSGEFSIEMKGGNNSIEKMEQDEKVNEATEESKEVEEVKEEVSEVKEESKEEAKAESEETEKAEPAEAEATEAPKESEELSSKLNLVLSELKKISEQLSKVNLSESEDSKESEEAKKEPEEKAEELSKKDAKSLAVVEPASVPKGYTKGDAELTEMLLSVVKQNE